ncbi:SDR family oxidoreductase [Novosphingobium huizhouense]|uniref:SDR family oxidoreductase n=1 Tax=Novosphingobium huizhouense TaxID=2866625 RepID=UPI001CD89737|nr:SDR family oxidoreductase [Novosphingobium huizhouense]
MSGDAASVARPLALVTGGWRRIGAAIAERLAAAGWDLALHAHHAATFDPAFAAQLEALGAQVHALEADLGKADAAVALIGRAASAAGRPATLLVNCASLFRDDDAHSFNAHGLAEHLQVNLAAPLLMTQAFAAALGDAPASVVMILDQRVLNPVPDQFSYTLSKQGLHAAVRTLARSLAPAVRVNGVAPGLTLPTADYDAAQWERLAHLMPLDRLADPAEIAEAVAYLAGAPSVTGQTIFVDAGAHLESYARDFVHLAK